MAKYEFKKTIYKFLWALGEIFIAGTIVYFTNRPEFLFLVPIAEAVRNWLKHRK